MWERHYSAFVGQDYAHRTMDQEDAPICVQHEGDVRMHLRTLHSDVSTPGQMVALYECPECGHERRLPMESAA